jgi:hypothetical protein
MYHIWNDILAPVLVFVLGIPGLLLILILLISWASSKGPGSRAIKMMINAHLEDGLLATKTKDKSKDKDKTKDRDFEDFDKFDNASYYIEKVHSNDEFSSEKNLLIHRLNETRPGERFRIRPAPSFSITNAVIKYIIVGQFPGNSIESPDNVPIRKIGNTPWFFPLSKKEAEDWVNYLNQADINGHIIWPPMPLNDKGYPLPIWIID